MSKVVLPIAMILGCVALAQADTSSPAQKGQRLITVADVVRQAVVGNPGEIQSNVMWPQSLGEFSPDGRHIAIVVRRGNLQHRSVDGELLVFKRQDLLPGGKGSAQPQTVARFSSTSNDTPIAKVRWLSDNESLVFAGASGDEPPQVYRVSIKTRQVKPLTHTKLRMVTYEVDATGEHVLYSEPMPPTRYAYDPECKQSGCVVTSDYSLDLFDGTSWNEESVSSHRLVLVEVARGQETVIANPDPAATGFGASCGQEQFALAPDGQSALRWCHFAKWPAEWREYSISDDSWEKSAVWYNTPGQYALIDLKDGTTRPVLPQPVDHKIGAGTDSLLWLDGRRVVLFGAMLPLAGVDARERARRVATREILEVDTQTGQTWVVADLDKQALYSNGMHWDARTQTLTVMPRGAAWESLPTHSYRRAEGRWTPVSGRQVAASFDPQGGDPAGEIALEMEQSLNDPPVLMAVDIKSGARRIVLDLVRPELAGIRLGRVSEYTFKSRTGVEWYGGLFLPPDYVQGQRYPLVISTHGFNKKAFTLYGDERVAMSAQPMAAQGFVVLQLQNPPVEVGIINPKEGPEEMAAYEAAIDTLDEAGLIDRTQVGLIAFSRSGTPVRYALAHSTYAFEAAIIAEGNNCAFSNYSISESWANLTERCIGATPYGTGLDVWRKESPSFTFERVRTPLRLEYHNIPWAIIGEWEYYNNLRHLGKPVEFFLLPEGTHQNNKTHHAYASMQGAVDWMNFWLKGYEDKDPAKREQYARWHVLRAKRDANDAAMKAESQGFQPEGQPSSCQRACDTGRSSDSVGQAGTCAHPASFAIHSPVGQLTHSIRRPFGQRIRHTAVRERGTVPDLPYLHFDCARDGSESHGWLAAAQESHPCPLQ